MTLSISRKKTHARRGIETPPRQTKNRSAYDTPGAFKEELPNLRRTNLGLTVTAAITLHMLIMVAATGGYGCLIYAPAWVWISNSMVGLLFIAVCMRGLEVLVHEGSHFNWTRRTRLNDFLTNMLAAIPMMSLVNRF